MLLALLKRLCHWWLAHQCPRGSARFQGCLRLAGDVPVAPTALFNRADANPLHAGRNRDILLAVSRFKRWGLVPGPGETS